MLRRKQQVSKPAKASEQKRNYASDAFVKVKGGDRVVIVKKKKDPKDPREKAETIQGTVMSKDEVSIIVSPHDGGFSKRVVLTEVERLSKK